MSKLPDSWALAPLGDLLSAVVGGGTPSKANVDHFRGSIPFMTVKDMHERFIGDTKDHITDAALAGSASTLVPADTLIVASRMSLGKIARPKVPVAINQDLKALFLHAGIDKTYIEYAWRANEARIREMGTGTTVKGIRLEDIRSLEVPVAPSAEQTRIADQLDTLLARVNACNDHLGAIPGILKRFRQAVLNAASIGALLAAEQTADWDATTVGEILMGKPRNGYSPKAVDYETPVRSLTLSATTSGRFNPRYSKFIDEHIPEDSHLWLEPGDILVQRANTLDYVGVSAIYDGPSKTFIYPDLMMKCRPQRHVRVKFLYYVLSSEVTRQHFRDKATGTAGNMPKINQQTVMSAPISIPSLDIQDEIIRRADELLELADQIAARHTLMRANAQRLAPQVLAKAFRGELVEQDPQDEPASVLLQRLAADQPTQASASRGRPRSRPKAQPSAPECPPTDWTSLPNGAWAAPADPEGQVAAVWLTAVLRAWREPMPERTARLASLLCQQPRLFTTVLSEEQAELWSRLVGDEAKPLPANVARFQPATNSHWGRAIKGMRVRGDLIEAGAGDEVTWTLGAGAASIETLGWPDGRAGFVVAHLRAHGVESILPSLEPAAQEFVDVKAA